MKATIFLIFFYLFSFGDINLAFPSAMVKPSAEQTSIEENIEKRKPKNRFWEYFAFIFIFPLAFAFLIAPSFIIGSISALVVCAIFGFPYNSSVFWIITACVGLLHFVLQLIHNYRKSTTKKNSNKKKKRLFSIKPFRS